MKRDCVICRGRGTIRLPVYRPAFVNIIADVGDIAPAGEYARTYPCPECGNAVALERVAVIETRAVMASEIEDAELMRHAERSTAHRLIGELLKADFVRFERGPTDEMQRTFPLRASLGVVAPRHVASMEERAASENERFARAVVAKAAEKIRQWGSHYTGDEGGIPKAQAVTMLHEALRAAVSRSAS
jgi:hypothetical protein